MPRSRSGDSSLAKVLNESSRCIHQRLQCLKSNDTASFVEPNCSTCVIALVRPHVWRNAETRSPNRLDSSAAYFVVCISGSTRHTDALRQCSGWLRDRLRCSHEIAPERAISWQSILPAEVKLEFKRSLDDNCRRGFFAYKPNSLRTISLMPTPRTSGPTTKTPTSCCGSKAIFNLCRHTGILFCGTQIVAGEGVLQADVHSAVGNGWSRAGERALSADS
jgi:hypothetical protein